MQQRRVKAIDWAKTAFTTCCFECGIRNFAKNN